MKKGLEVDWDACAGRGGQPGDDDVSTSSGDQGTETAVSLSRWRADAGSAQSALSRRDGTAGRPSSAGAAAQLKAERALRLKQVQACLALPNVHRYVHQLTSSGLDGSLHCCSSCPDALLLEQWQKLAGVGCCSCSSVEHCILCRWRWQEEERRLRLERLMRQWCLRESG